ncbi:hypothetical protein HZC31_05685 [Candidatus Woesearchaeota archaeon]|nr:hypothetical protein [Candidatus Woesearchaeota archaeon]
MKKLLIDSCSIILLAKASVLEKLAEVHEATITSAVAEEVLAGKKKLFADALLLDRLLNEKKIRNVFHPKEITEKIMNDYNMGKGEASIIAVGLKEKEIIIVTDNLQGRKVAKVFELPLVGSIECIVSLYKNKKITKEKAKESLEILKKEGWFQSYLIEDAEEDLK